jgi:glycosyltransferase involved in cell wall biosynthesis
MDNFSVVVTSYNEEENIGRLLDSILRQRLKPSEIIIVDDSTDRTPEIIRSYSNSLPIKLVKKKYRIGCEKGRLLGLKMAKGDYVALLYADTSLEKNFFEELLKPLKNDEIGAVGVTQLIPKNVRGMDRLFTSFRVAGAGKDKFVSHIVDGAYKKKILEEVGYFDPKFEAAAEVDLSKKILKKGYKILKSGKARVYLWEGGKSDKLSKKLKREITYAKPIFKFCRKYPEHIKWPLFQLVPLTFPLAFIYIPYLYFLLLYFILFSVHSSITTYRKLKNLKLSVFAFFLRPVRLVLYDYGFLVGIFRKQK